LTEGGEGGRIAGGRKTIQQRSMEGKTGVQFVKPTIFLDGKKDTGKRKGEE